MSFDAIACRGISGLAFAAPLAYLMRKELIVVRKPGETSHGGQSHSVSAQHPRILIVDDFISCGNTVAAIREQLTKLWRNSHEVVGLYLYEQNCDINVTDFMVERLGHSPMLNRRYRRDNTLKQFAYSDNEWSWNTQWK